MDEDDVKDGGGTLDDVGVAFGVDVVVGVEVRVDDVGRAADWDFPLAGGGGAIFARDVTGGGTGESPLCLWGMGPVPISMSPAGSL